MNSLQPIVQLQGVQFSYGAERFSLRVQDLRLVPGESVVCMGPSGSGKTTLLELMAGLHTPEHGRIDFQGRTWSDFSGAQKQRQRLQHMGLVFQGFELLAALTLEENILLPLRLLGLPVRPKIQRAQELMDAVGIRTLAHQKPQHCSFGERQRAAICRALITEPLVVLADEPTANLDENSAAQALALLLEDSKARQSSLFLISHDPGHVARVDRLLSMESLGQAVVS